MLVGTPATNRALAETLAIFLLTCERKLNRLPLAG